MNKILTRVAILGLAGVAVAGCGSSSGTKASANTGAGGPSSGAPGGGSFDFSKIQKYTECLSKHGLDVQGGGNGPPLNGGSLPQGGSPPNGGSLPQGGSPPNGGSLPKGFTPPSGGSGANGGGLPGVDQSDPKAKKAMKACKSLQPKFPGGGQFGNPGGGSNQATTTTGQSN